MTTVVFFEKPGCINNTKQKKLLREAGHTVIERNLLTEGWTADRLRPFFGDKPVGEWFNRSAPAVKEGRVRPEAVDETEALALMVREPLLIRRPLMEVAGEQRAGFDPAAVDAWIGLQPRTGPEADLETCPRQRAPDPPAGGCA
jgi:nitrogenase-associated protein